LVNSFPDAGFIFARFQWNKLEPCLVGMDKNCPVFCRFSKTKHIVRKRLELMYGSRFEPNRTENEDYFEINVKIPLNEN